MPRMFNVMDVEYSELIRQLDSPQLVQRGDRRWSSPPAVYMSAENANQAAQRFTAVCQRKFQLRPVKLEGDAWKIRELERLMSDEYDPLPWRGVRPADYLDPERYRCEWTIYNRTPEAEFHFPHLSKRVKGNIAFTENAEKGASDIQTTMKPGRYLKRFYPGLDEHRVRQLANEIIARFGTCKFALATTPEEIEAVYTNGPNSCMSTPASSFSTNGVHPASVYGAGDLAVAYLMVMPPDNEGASAEETAETELDLLLPPVKAFPGPICARSLCWPTKKIHGRIYGDTQKMSHFLKENGYEEIDGWDFEGARLLRIPLRNGAMFVCPYIDGDQRQLRDTGTFLVLDPDGRINGETTSGRAENFSEPSHHCNECGDDYEENDMVHVRQAPGAIRLWMCQGCADDHTFYCNYSGDTYVDTGDNAVSVGSRNWHEYFATRYAFRSARDNEYHPISDRVRMGNDEYWTREERDHEAEISATGQYWPTEEMVTCADGQRRHPTEVSPTSPSIMDEFGTLLNSLHGEGVTTNE